MQCENKVAIVTGAAGSGMGRSIALTLAREGARLVINYRTSSSQEGELVDYIESQSGEAVAIRADVFTPDGCQHLAEATLRRFGRVDICVIGPGGGWHPESVEALEPATALEDLEHEVAPLFYLMPLVLPGMYERQWGRLIGISLNPGKLSPAYAYNVGKAARTQALLLSQDQAWSQGVTVNVIAPGPVPAIESLDEAIDQCHHRGNWVNRGDVSPQDIAEGVAFLCSEAGRFVTGCVLPYAFRQ